MGRLGTVLGTLKTAIVTSLNNAGVSQDAQVGIGWPNFEDLTKIITAGGYQVTVYTDDSGTRDTTRFFPQWSAGSPVNVSLSAAVSGKVITFAGSVPTSGTQYNVHTMVGAPLDDTLVQTIAGDTPASVATKVAAAINAAAISGVSATASANAVTVNGSPYIKCNIGGSATLAREVLRVKRLVQVIGWTPDPGIREAVEDAIVSSIGNVGNRRLALGDGTNTVVFYHDNFWDDQSQQDFSIYRTLMKFTMEYGVLQTQQGTQIGAIQIGRQINGVTIPTVTEG